MLRSLLVLLALSAWSRLPVQTRSYPEPQIASAVGQVAPEFSLKDENGATFDLARQRGNWVLLYFYRGYW